MLKNFLKDLSILKKFLFINSIIFLIIGSLTILYLKNVRPNLIQKKNCEPYKNNRQYRRTYTET